MQYIPHSLLKGMKVVGFNDDVLLFTLQSFHHFGDHALNPCHCIDVCMLLLGKLLAAEQETASQALQIKALQGYTLCFITYILNYKCLLHRLYELAVSFCDSAVVWLTGTFVI